MKPFPGAIRLQEIYEALVPYKIKYPYKVVKEDNKVENKTELFPEKEKESFIDETREIEIGTNYKLRPIIIIYRSKTDNTYLAIAITKRKDDNKDYLLAVCKNEIKERHFLPSRKYDGTLKFDSYVLVDYIYLVTENNIYYPRGRLGKDDYDEIRAKLKNILSLNPPS
jgi:hypothetical protein